MKKLSIQEKAKRYDEAIQRARQFMETPYLENSDDVVGFIFPELKESDRERIRKSLIDYLKERKSCESYGQYIVRYDRWIAWLEKQGEHKPDDKVKPKFKVGDKIKLAEEPKYPAREIIAIKNDAYYFDRLVHLPFSHQDEWELVEQNSTWSEGDEKFFKTALWHISNSISNGHSTDIHCDTTDWFKSLKDRVQHQSQWKPSGEHMDAVKDAIDYLGGNTKIVRKHLMSLYDQLKKLREE